MLFPLFHRASFEVLFERQYSDNPPTDSGWYAAFNMVLAISCRLRISHTPVSSADNPILVVRHAREAWGYLQNAAAVLTELLLRNADLMSIQAILAMVCPHGYRYLQQRSNRSTGAIHARNSATNLFPHCCGDQNRNKYWHAPSGKFIRPSHIRG